MIARLDIKLMSQYESSQSVTIIHLYIRVQLHTTYSEHPSLKWTRPVEILFCSDFKWCVPLHKHNLSMYWNGPFEIRTILNRNVKIFRFQMVSIQMFGIRAHTVTVIDIFVHQKTNFYQIFILNFFS